MISPNQRLPKLRNLPKNKNMIVMFLNFLCMSVCLSARLGYSHSNCSRILKFWRSTRTHICLKRFFWFLKFWFYNPQHAVYFSHCLFTSNVYLSLLIFQRRLPKPRYMPKTENMVVQLQSDPTLQPSPHCLVISLFTYVLSLLQPTDFPEWSLPKTRDLPKHKIGLFCYNQKLATIARVEF